MMRRAWFVLPAVLCACSGPSLPEPADREPGTVVGVTGIYDDRKTTEALQAPESAAAGSTFTVQVTTYGSSSCTEPKAVAREQQLREVDLVPYDRVAPPGSICTADLRAFRRDVELRFDTPGQVVVRLRGRNLYGGIETVERKITIY